MFWLLCAAVSGSNEKFLADKLKKKGNCLLIMFWLLVLEVWKCWLFLRWKNEKWKLSTYPVSVIGAGVSGSVDKFFDDKLKMKSVYLSCCWGARKCWRMPRRVHNSKNSSTVPDPPAQKLTRQVRHFSFIIVCLSVRRLEKRGVAPKFLHWCSLLASYREM